MNLLSEISWKHYEWAVATIAVLYYAYVLRRYYADEIAQLFTQLTNSSSHITSKRSQLSNFENPSERKNKDDHADLKDVSDLISRVQDFFSRISLTSPTEDEIKKYIGLLLQEYQEIKDESVRHAINQLILSECQKHYTVILSEEDINELWNKQ